MTKGTFGTVAAADHRQFGTGIERRARADHFADRARKIGGAPLQRDPDPVSRPKRLEKALAGRRFDIVRRDESQLAPNTPAVRVADALMAGIDMRA